MTRTVLDTNIVVSGLLYSGAPKRLLEAVRAGLCTAFASPRILSELLRVLSYPRLERRASSLGTTPAALVRDWSSIVLVVPDAPSPLRCRDAADEPYLGVAVAVRAHFLVTGDKDLLSLEKVAQTRIVGAQEFLNQLARAEPW